jgi:hypothetical protein
MFQKFGGWPHVEVAQSPQHAVVKVDKAVGGADPKSAKHTDHPVALFRTSACG